MCVYTATKGHSLFFSASLQHVPVEQRVTCCFSQTLFFQMIVIKRLCIVRCVFPDCVIHNVTNERLIITC